MKRYAESTIFEVYLKEKVEYGIISKLVMPQWEVIGCELVTDEYTLRKQQPKEDVVTLLLLLSS